MDLCPLLSYDRNVISTHFAVCKKGMVTKMSKREQYEEKAEKLITPIIEENQFELVDMEYVKEGSNWYLRAYIDKPGGITIEDCEQVSRAFSEVLDKEDYIENSYILEVSSPGLSRPLKKVRDFERSIGKKVEVRTYQLIDRQKEFVGILKEYNQNAITIEIEGEEKMLEKSQIALVRLAFDF